MDSSLGLALSAKSAHGSRLAVAYESASAPGSNVNDAEGLQYSAVPLSARERMVVLLMGHGLTNKMIARQLGIAPSTVKAHAKRIFWKLTAQSRAQAVYRASALGFI